MEAPVSERPDRLGTFLGVFAPTFLVSLGTVLFPRAGALVGGVGLGAALALLVLVAALGVITVMSTATLVTSPRPGGRGARFVLSRSLGEEVGGAIAMPLLLAQALAVSLSAAALAELFVGMLPWLPQVPVAALLVVGLVAGIGRFGHAPRWIVPTLLGIAALGPVSLWAGLWLAPPVWTAPSRALDAWDALTLLFPISAGVLTGLGLCGEIAQVDRSLPRGSLGGVAAGWGVSAAVLLALAAGGAGAGISGWAAASAMPEIVLPAAIAALVGSAVVALWAAGQTLAALAGDGLAPRPLGEIQSRSGLPLAALWLTGGVAILGVLPGSVEAIATLLTVVLLAAFATLGLIAGLLELVDEPSFRPSRRVHWGISLGGAAVYGMILLAIAPWSAAGALAAQVALWFALRRRTLRTTWGEVTAGLWYVMARSALLALRGRAPEPHQWRPHPVVLVVDLARSLHLVRLASALGQDRGIVTVATLRVGEVGASGEVEERQLRDETLLAEAGLLAFAEVVTVPRFEEGVITVAQASGLGGLSPNTVLLGWPADEAARVEPLLDLVSRLSDVERCTMIFRPGVPSPPDLSDIVVWWKGREHNGDLMLLLAHLLSQSEGWAGSRIVLKAVVDDQETRRARQREFAAMLPEIRVDVEVDVLLRGREESVHEVIRAHSAGARLVLLGLGAGEPGTQRGAAEALVRLVDGLPDALLVRNAGPFRGRLV